MLFGGAYYLWSHQTSSIYNFNPYCNDPYYIHIYKRFFIYRFAKLLCIFACSIIRGTTLNRSPHIPCRRLKYWAVLLLFTARCSASCMPALCRIAPEIPSAMYNLGRTVFPVDRFDDLLATSLHPLLHE